MRELAETHGIKSARVMRRAANEKWEAARKQGRQHRLIKNQSREFGCASDRIDNNSYEYKASVGLKVLVTGPLLSSRISQALHGS